MDRHDAKPRRPSLLADVEPQRPTAPGPQPARILADMERPTTRPRGGGARPGRAWLLGGAGVALLALLAVWLGGSDDPAAPVDTPAATAVVETAPPDAAMPVATATIVDEGAGASGAAPADNPFEVVATGGDAKPVLTPAAATSADNPFAPLDAAGGAPVRAVAPTASAGAPRPATASRTAPPPATRTAKPATAATARKPARAGAGAGAGADEPDLLDTLMDNIQQSSTTELPTRDTRGMDRLVRDVNRPAAEPVGKGASGAAAAATVALAAKPAGTAPTPTAAAAGKNAAPPVLPERQLRSLLAQCPDTVSPRSIQCRRNICRQYAPDDKRCMRR